MPSWVAHAFAGLAVASLFTTKQDIRRVSVTAIACTVLPDIDAIGRPFGVGDIEALGGHRGFTHSITFAALLGASVAWGVFGGERWKSLRLRLWLCFTLVTLTHGVLDGLTTVGDGVKFLSPFSDRRYVFEWQPIDPSRVPASVRPTGRLASVAAEELYRVVFPCTLVIVIASRLRGLQATARMRRP